MFPKIILKLLDATLLPSLLVFSVKFLSLLCLAVVWRQPFNFDRSGLIFQNPLDLYQVNSISNMALLVFTSACLFFSLIRLRFFTENGLSPLVSARLVNAGLESFIVSLSQGYIRVTVWLTLFFSLTLSLLIQGLLGLSPFYLFVFALGFFTLGVFFFSLSLERDWGGHLDDSAAVVIIEGAEDA